MKKVNKFLLLLAILALTGSMANVMAQSRDIPTSMLGEYVGSLHVSSTLLGLDETFYGVTIELKESASNYALKVAEMDLGGGNYLPEYELDDVEITQSGAGYQLSRSGALNIVIDEIEVPPIPVIFPQGGTLYDVPVAITLEDGYIENNVLTLNIKAVATILAIIPVTINIDFEGMLPPPPACDPVTNAKAEIENCETATITWNTVAGAKNYEIAREGVETVVVATPPYTETAEFEHGKSYTWTIKTICDENESTEVPASTTANCETETCNPATDLTVEFIKHPACAAELIWTAAAGMPDAKYNVYKDGEKIKGDLEGTEYVDLEVEENVEYTWAVKTICADGEAEGVEVKGTCEEQNINELANSISIYPNPTSGMVTINAKDFAKVEVYNTVGQLIETTTDNVVDVSSCDTGIYFFKVYDVNGNIVTQRVMVAR